MKRRLAAILAADLVGYSRLVRADEEGTLAALRALRGEELDPAIAEHNGRIVKWMGDGVLAEFASVVDAVRAAIRFQQSMTGTNAERPAERQLEFRIGINLGDVVIDGDDIHGDGVNLAARLEGLAEPGGVCISDSVHDQVRDRLDIRFTDLGSQRVKNIDRPVRVWQWTDRPGANASATRPVEQGSDRAQQISIAVLPFNNMSGDPEQEYFSDGITEDIITELSKIPTLFVVARNTTFTYKNQPKNLQDVARELSVDHLVEGSVRKAGNRVRITAQLIDGRTGGHIWAERYDRELTDIFAVQDEISAEIISAMHIVLQPKERGPVDNSRTRDLNAYDLYMQGRRQQHMFVKPSLEAAIRLFRQAISIDGHYARAYCGIADSSAFLYQFHIKTDEILNEINEMSAMALDLAPDMPEAHVSRGYAYFSNGDYASADRAFAKAVELDANLYEAHLFWGRSHMARGNYQEAARHLRNALTVSPHDDQSAAHLMQMLEALNETDEMIRIARRTVSNALRKQQIEPDNVRAYLNAAFAYLRLGDMANVEKQVGLAQAMDPEESSIHYNLACLFALTGDQASALDRLEHCVRAGDYNKTWLENDSDLDSLRAHPRFVRLLEAVE